jgi:hypothetical protein
MRYAHFPIPGPTSLMRKQALVLLFVPGSGWTSQQLELAERRMRAK